MPIGLQVGRIGKEARAAGRSQGLGWAGGCLSAAPASFLSLTQAEGVEGALGSAPKGWRSEARGWGKHLQPRGIELRLDATRLRREEWQWLLG